jgi:cytochrome c-type biogenesis protein
MNLSSSPVDYLLAFAGGILMSLSPCVYPLIPVSISFIGVRSDNSKLRGFILSLAYVTGIAVIYSLLGLVASLSGVIFGTISSHPLTNIAAGLVIVLFGISMFGIFQISLPVFKQPQKIRKAGYFSAFLLGLSSGLVISPCTTPALGAILVYLTSKKNIFYGTTLLFTFAFGMGLILILAGTFGALLMGLPKAGRWMLYLKRIAALIVLGTGVYFILLGIRRL